MRRLRVSIFLLVTVTLWALSGPFIGRGKDRDNFYVKDGDRLVFYGDSITDQRLYTAFVETYIVTRFPRLRASFVHSDWGGDRVTGGGGGPIEVRLRRDIIAYKPTVVTVMLGMNDAGYRPYDSALFNTYSAGMKHIVDSLRSALPGIRITLIQPSPFDDVTRPPNFAGGYNAVLTRYGDYVKQLSERDGLTVADLNAPVVDMLQKARAADPKLAEKIIPDRVHPGPGGHLSMAEALLKAWNAPAVVAAVEIDAARGRLAKAENASVTELKGDSSLSWTERDDALPMPIDLSDPVVALAIRSSDFASSLDQQTLKVTGLAAAEYALKIDGEEVGSFSRQQLAEGINLAVLPTPMARQAAQVHGFTLKHNEVHFARWRQIQVPLEDLQLPGKQAALAALDKLEEELIGEQRAAARPQPRHYELAPK